VEEEQASPGCEPSSSKVFGQSRRLKLDLDQESLERLDLFGSGE
jgi:hypothetical protein